MDGYTDNDWEDIELRIDPDPFCTSCQIYSMNKKAGSKNPLKPKSPLKWGFMDIISSTAPKQLTSDTTFYNYILIVDAYSKIHILCCMEKITTEEVMDKLDMFQSRRCREAIYLNRLQRIMSNSPSSFDISGSRTSGN